MLTRDFLIELGCEELPALQLYKATEQFGKLIVDGLDAAGLSHGVVKTMSTPRRISVIIADVAEQTEEVHNCFRGPSVKIAFDADGNPTKAATGFARGKGAAAEDLVVREDNGVEYVFLETITKARKAQDILSEICTGSISKVSWVRSQRWGRTSERFGRAVRWIVALFGDEIVPVTFAGLESGRASRGLRVLNNDPTIVDVASYEKTLEDAGVIVDTDRRRAIIREGIASIEQETGYTADIPQKVFDEVVNLVEYPRPMKASFDEIFLNVPQEIIVESMLTNQRYFPLYDSEGKLTRDFIIVANTPLDVADTVIDGNERVVRARLYDAKFFYDEDLKVSMETFRSRLEKVGFQEKLGSVLQKVERIEKLVPAICAGANVDAAIACDAARAAHLCKADLVSSAVVEFTSQQGVMGGYYAKAAGESEDCAIAITDHYRPRFAGDELPRNVAGSVVAVADKLDTICGIFAIDEAPTGSSDPFALRRAAIGIIAILRDVLPQDIAPLVDTALDSYTQQALEFDKAAVKAAVLDFIMGRLVSIAKRDGAQPDTIAAVSAAGILAPHVFFARISALDNARANDAETFEDLGIAFARASHITDASLGVDCDESMLAPVETELLAAITNTAQVVDAALAQQDYDRVFASLAGLRGPIDKFFDEVLVMDNDVALRENHLRLLNRFCAIFSGIADMGAFARKK